MKHLLGHNFWIGLTYAVGDFFVLGSRFILALIYANFLSAEEYGVLSVAIAVSTIIGVLTTFGLKAAVFEQSFKYEDEIEQKRFYGTVWLFLLLVSGLIVLGLDQLFAKTQINIFLNVPFEPYLRLAIWSSYLNGFGLVLFEVFRAKRKPGPYIAASIGNAATLLLFAYLLIGFTGAGVLGALYAMLGTGLIWAILYTIILAPNLKLAFDKEKLRSALRYSLPLVPHFLAHWLLSLSDRAILERTVPLNELGIYSLGYNIGNVQQVLSNSGNSTLMPYFGAARRTQDSRQELSNLFAGYIRVMALTSLALSLFSGEVIRTLTSLEYHPAAAVVPWVTLGFFNLALYYGPMNLVTLLAGATKRVWLFTIMAGAVNLGCNLWLVPHFGIIAAAVNTFLGYLVLFGLIEWHSRRTQTFRLNWMPVAETAFFLILGVVFDALLEPNAIWGEVAIDLALLFFSTILIFRRQLPKMDLLSKLFMK